MLVLAGLLLTGCGQADKGADSVSVPNDSPGGSTTTPAAASELKITVRDSPEAAPKVWTLTCEPVGGDHPDPAAACQAITTARQAFTPVAKDQICTEIFGGPQTATIVGTWEGEPVNASFSRTNGCEIARWKQLSAVFQTNTGVDPG